MFGISERFLTWFRHVLPFPLIFLGSHIVKEANVLFNRLINSMCKHRDSNCVQMETVQAPPYKRPLNDL